MAMYSDPTTENFNKIKQTIQEKEKKILDLYPYLSQDKIMSQEEHEKEAVKVMKRIKDQLSDVKLNETSLKENIQEGRRFINLANEIYILSQQEKKLLQEDDQSIQKLQQAEKQVLQAREQLHQARKQLEQAKKQLIPMQEKLRLINKQKNLFIDVLNSNKMILMQKLTAE